MNSHLADRVGWVSRWLPRVAAALAVTCLAMAARNGWVDWRFTQASELADGVVVGLALGEKMPIVEFVLDDGLALRRTMWWVEEEEDSPFEKRFRRGDTIPVRVAEIGGTPIMKFDVGFDIWFWTLIMLGLTVIFALLSAYCAAVSKLDRVQRETR